MVAVYIDTWKSEELIHVRPTAVTGSTPSDTTIQATHT